MTTEMIMEMEVQLSTARAAMQEKELAHEEAIAEKEQTAAELEEKLFRCQNTQQVLRPGLNAVVLTALAGHP